MVFATLDRGGFFVGSAGFAWIAVKRGSRPFWVAIEAKFSLIRYLKKNFKKIINFLSF